MRSFVPRLRSGHPERLRIGYARIFHEANAYSPLLTAKEDFLRFHHLRGEALHHASGPRGSELKGFLRYAELSGFRASVAWPKDNIEAHPLMSALAVPSGPMTRETFDWLVDDLLAQLSAAPALDGLYLALHGSMRVQGEAQAPEALLLQAVRAQVGALPIAVSYDLHANLSDGLVEPVQVLVGYRTNPHRDLFQTGYRAGRLLARSLREEVRPSHRYRKLPVVLGGGQTIDFLQPMRPIFSRLRRMERQERVLSASLFMVHPYSDAEDLGWAAHVCTDDDPTLAQQLVEELSALALSVKDAPLPKMRTVSEALDEVQAAPLRRKLGAVSIVDVDDVVGTGAPGGNTRVIEQLIERQAALRVYVPIHDPAVVERCWSAGQGRLSVTLRGTPGLSQPEVQLQAILRKKLQTEFGRTALLQVEGLFVAVTERPPYTVRPGFWRDLGLSPWEADAIVQKSFFHYRMFYAASARGHIPVVTDGPSSLAPIRAIQEKLDAQIAQGAYSGAPGPGPSA